MPVIWYVVSAERLWDCLEDENGVVRYSVQTLLHGLATRTGSGMGYVVAVVEQGFALEARVATIRSAL